MERSHIIRQSLVALGIGAWAFLMLSLASFHPADWPSHTVFPYPPTRNLCGNAGAFIAYYAFLAIGQGVFPVLFFTGVSLALLMFKNRVGDLWLRAVGLVVLSIAFSAVVHNLRPGSFNGFPEGHGGILGIVTSTYLQSHFNTVGARLILLTAIMIGLLLVADDLVLKTPGVVAATIATAKQHAPSGLKLPNFRFPELPKLPALPRFVTRDAVTSAPASKKKASDDDDLEDLKPPVLLDTKKIAPHAQHEDIDLKYDNDEPV